MNHHILGVELEPWQAEIMTSSIPNLDHTPKLLSETLNLAEIEVLTTFIYSKVTGDMLMKMPKLKFIATRSTGFDHIDVQACKQHGILVSNVPSYGENTVAEQAFALLLALTRKIVPSVEQTRRNDFSVDALQGVDLAKKTIGVVGTGRIGQHAIRMAKGFNMTVVAYDPFPKPELASELGFQYSELDNLLALSDVVTLHAPATKETFHLLDERRLRLMKPGAFLINTARGSLVDTQALARVLDQGHLAGVGLDVVEEENAMRDSGDILSPEFHSSVDLKTLLAGHILADHPRVLMTPHNAFNTREALARIITTSAENINAFLRGSPQNVVNQ